jgi:glutamate synthase domain-containing protein 1
MFLDVFLSEEFMVKNVNFNKDELLIDKTITDAANPLGDCVFVISSSRRTRIYKKII